MLQLHIDHRTFLWPCESGRKVVDDARIGYADERHGTSSSLRPVKRHRRPRGTRTMNPPRAGGSASTRAVPNEIFRQVYDSPRSLPGKERWLTRDDDVREIERILGMEPNVIGAPLWVSGDSRDCPSCGRETNWLDIVSSALADVHDARMIATVILGDKKFVNVEAPRAIDGLRCHACKTPIRGLRSFKCHNWAYAIGRLKTLVESLPAAR